mgnify:FL=1
MKANEIYQQNADQLYAQIGHAVMQKKQLEQQVEEADLNIKDLEFKLKALVLSHPHILKVEQALDSDSGWKDKEI